MKKKPRWGQNFLIDSGAASRIIEIADIGSSDSVLEIGPGKGILTRELAKRAGRLLALEIDPGLCADLKKHYSDTPGFKLIEADALRFDYSGVGDRFKVVSNLPYYAATHILKRLIHYRQRIVDMTVMLQKEVVERLTANPGQKAYCSLTVFVRYHCRVERMLEVKKHAFSPPPKVDSAVVRLVPHPRPPVAVTDEKVFFHIVHAAFLHKRKMLRNNLREWQSQFLVEHDKIELAGIDLSRRGETLSLEEFAALSNHIRSKNA
jgi:16S rRNA (adenine1518-N6/adenine1519-N6)-dimethyltransferase